jgi:hypothetical protein
MAVGSIALPSAEAGQPWSCVCKGKPQRFIAGTKACEWAQPKNKRFISIPGGRRLLSACTRAEFTAWNKNACKQEGCSPPKGLK